MPTRPLLLLILACAAAFPAWIDRADPPAPAGPPSAAPTPDPASAERRALAERLAALPDADFTAYLQGHPEAAAPPMVLAILRYGRELGMHGDNAAHARLIQRAGAMAAASGDRLSQARVQWNAAGLEGELHHVDKGLAMINAALALAEAEKAPARDLAGMLGCRVILYGYKGEYARSMADCDRALRLATEANYPEGAMAALTTLINIYQRQGQPAQSIPFLEQARKWAAGNDHMGMYVEANYATTYHQLGQTGQARASLGRALATARRIGDDNMVADLLSADAQYAREAKDFPAARRALDEAFALSDKLGNDRVRVDARLQLAELEQAQGHAAAAAEAARTALAGAEGTGEMESVSQAQDALGRALAASGQTVDAMAAFRAAVDTIEQIRTDTAGGEESAQAMLQEHIDPYQRLTALLVAAGRVPEAFAVAENAKARVLRDILQGGRLDLAGALTDDERQRREASQQGLATLNHRLQEARRVAPAASGGSGEGTPPGPAAASLQRDLDAARIAARNLDDALLTAHPEVRRRGVPTPAGSPDAAASLGSVGGADTLFLEYAASPDATTLFVSGPGNLPLEAHALPVGTDELRRRVEGFRGSLADRALNWREDADALGRLLLAPAAARLARAGRVVIVPDGPLWDLPFQALRQADGTCLVDHLAVSYAPSAAFLARERHDAPARPAGEGRRLLAMGNPALGTGAENRPAAALMGDAFAPLPAAEEEVRLLGKMYDEQGSGVFVGAQAREDVFKREAPRCDIIHLATHGLLNDANPLYSCLLMSQVDLGPGEDGLLEAREIMDLHLHARLAILAACETARGRAGAGEGQLGLSWALLVAGCPASVVSQWKVDSHTNVDLMLELHRQLRAGKPADEALRQAALALRRTPGHDNPFYWAPFVVVGTDEPPATKHP